MRSVDAYITHLQSFARSDPSEYLRLDRITRLLEHLGNPHAGLTGVHVAGTNGKGSVVAMTRSVLLEAGYTVGSFLSPHLVRLNERFVVNGKEITDAQFASLLGYVRPAVTRVEKELRDRPSWFEVMAAMAFLFFKKKKVEVAVVEVGLGGTWDATNVLDFPVIAIPTIALDHTHILGTTVQRIAKEKAGIIKSNAKHVITGAEEVAVRVIGKQAKKVGARMVVVDKDIVVRDARVDWKGTSALVALWGRGRIYASPNRRYHTNLIGTHQAYNMAVALGAINALRSEGFTISQAAVRRGLERVSIIGRFQVIGRGKDSPRVAPVMVLDGAHNPAALQRLRATLHALAVDRKQCVAIFGAKDTKDYKRMAGTLKKIATTIYLPHFSHLPYMFSPIMLKEALGYGEVTKDFVTALRRVEQERPKVILITGSLYFVGEVLRGMSKKRYTTKDVALDSVW